MYKVIAHVLFNVEISIFEIFRDIRNVWNRVVILKVYSSNFRDAHYIIVKLCKTKIERTQFTRIIILITSKITHGIA